MNDIISFPKGFWLRPSGSTGQELISPSGKILAWTTDAAFGEFLCRVCNHILTDGDPLEAAFGEEEKT